MAWFIIFEDLQPETAASINHSATYRLGVWWIRRGGAEPDKIT